MIRQPPRSTRTDTRFPYTTLFRSGRALGIGDEAVGGAMRRDDLHLVRDAEFLEKLDRVRHRRPVRLAAHDDTDLRRAIAHHPIPPAGRDESRSEEHTSELQSLMRTSYAVFCLTKKK